MNFRIFYYFFNPLFTSSFRLVNNGLEADWPAKVFEDTSVNRDLCC